MHCTAAECTEKFCEFGCLREHEVAIRNLVYHITHNSNEVDDITQEVFMKAYQSLASFRGGSFRAYLARIARNHCYDMLRRKRVRPETLLGDMTVEEWPGVDDGPEDLLLNKEMAGEIQQLLNQLSDVDREIIVLRHLSEFSYDEIAETMGMRPGAVRTRISRARQKMLELVEGRGQGEASAISPGMGLPRR
ncbi:RNA polymerase sigma factor [Alicyclobacillus mengziensis]|uniref:RNA polymerase sigma factor n=1 Tax=Alicyclobacillus mengziensis TaxID=2931921 RepID=A0A9X7W2N8_9BACL|nr:RNA polymerase sigma factor [Alicyclobacillus mengziensis]QSO49062.1 RNA polymerase sigma factor [Alicyclobacillus mengziensis]